MHEDAALTIGVFSLPQGAAIPLHDHPGMTVFSRLLYGRLHVRSFDFVVDQSEEEGSEGLEEEERERRRDEGGTATMEEEEDDEEESGRRRRSSGGGGGGSGDEAEQRQQQQQQPGRTRTGASRPRRPRRARLVADRILTAWPQPLGGREDGSTADAEAATTVLFPSSGGNVHTFTALTPCAVLDVLAPPYAPSEGRDCSYYRELPVDVEAAEEEDDDEEREAPPAAADPATTDPSSSSVDALLEEIDAPADFVVVRGRYRGLRVVP
jgi:hypothetical protein